ncbi:MAG: hypothetical protein GX902_05575 [Lentisphaerae bacterium]|nr:hypothetical protein [Lentisphaerota bacterium]
MKCLLCFVLFLPWLLSAEVFKPAQVTASSFSVFNVKKEQHDPELTADGKTGSPTSYWGSDIKVKPPHWLLFDFGREITCNTIVLDMVRCTFKDSLTMAINEFRLEYEENGSFKTLAECDGLLTKYRQALAGKDLDALYNIRVPELRQVFQFKPVTTSKIRLVVMDQIARLDEMTVSFEKGKAPTPRAEPKAAPPIDDGVLRFAFAPENAELYPGFVRGEFKSASKIYYSDRGENDLVRRYLARGTGDATFTVPVKPGIYRVMVMGGDLRASTPGAKLLINGDSLTIPPNFENVFFWDERTVEATEAIRIDAQGDWLVNAILIAPLEATEAYDAAVNRLVIGAAFSQLKLDPQPSNTQPPTVSAQEREAGYLFYTPSLQQRIFSFTTPLDSQKAAAVNAAAAGNTSKAISIAAYALKHISGFTVTVRAPALNGVSLPTSIHPIRCWPQRTGHKGSARTYFKVPELLDDNRPALLEEATSRQYYILVDVPSGTRPGLYTGSVDIAGNGITSSSIPFNFTVHPFELEPLDKKQYAAMYMSDGIRGGIAVAPPRFTPEEQLTMDRERLADMRKHNMNSIVFPYVRYQNKEQFEQVYLTVNQRLDEAGFPRLPLPHHNQALTKQMVEEILEIVARTGLREILFYPVDEPHFDKRHIADVMYPMVKTVPGARTYSTVSQQDVDSFGKSLDFRCYMVGKTNYHFEPERILEDCKRDGAHFWWYTNAAREYPDCTRYKAGFFQYKCQATGQLYWAYDNQRNDPFNDFDSTNDHLSIIYIGKKIYSTIQWEGIREGLDDLRYAYLLDDLVAAAPADSPEAKYGKAVQERIKTETVTDLDVFKEKFGEDIAIHQQCLWEPEKFDELRDATIQAILKLKQLGK